MDYLMTNCKEYCYRDLETVSVMKKRGKRTVKIEYLKAPLCLDTETAWNHDLDNPISWIYQWAFEFGGDIVIGRKPSDLVNLLARLKEYYGLCDTKILVIYVHNLSYDIQYLKQALQEKFGKPRLLAIRAHKFITYEIGGIQFRCSYKLSNKGLFVWGNDLNVTHKKLSETADFYKEIHYQNEELPAENWEYQINDVLCLSECLQKQFDLYGDTVATVPLTSTGYIRRECRKNYKEDRRNRKRFVLTQLNTATYDMCKNSFAGGLTHGNRFLCNYTVRPSKNEYIKHRDFRSHYPTQQRTKKFPMGKFNLYGKNLKIEDIKKHIGEYNFLIQFTFENAKVKDGVVLPILSQSKVYAGRQGKIDTIEDNGRVLVLHGITSICITELDLHWILKQYDIKYYNIDVAYSAVSGYLPKYMTKTVDTFFHGKTMWKMLVKEAEQKGETDERIAYLNMELMKSKNGLNGIYGMTATDIVRDIFSMDEMGNWKMEKPDKEKALSQYYTGENNFNPYQWGVWTTAWARHDLLTFAELIQKNGGTILYVDTDSIFYVSNDNVERVIERENARREQKAVEMGAFITYDGKRVTYDCFDLENEEITAFRFLHAKCYAYMVKTETGEKLKCVIAGVSAYEDNTYKYSREMELGSIDNLEKGKTFTRCGGTRAIYTENPFAEIEIDGHLTECGAACVIVDTTKTLNDCIGIYEMPFSWEADF